MVSDSRTPLKSIKNGSNKDSKTDHLKRHPLSGPGPSRKEKGLEKGAPEGPQGVTKGGQTAKNESREGLKIHLVSQVGPERVPRGPGVLRGVLFSTFWVTLLGSCVTVSP